MKLTLANALVGSIFCCLIWSSPTLADDIQEVKAKMPAKLSADVLTYDRLSIFPFNVNLIEHIIPPETQKAVDILINRDNWLMFEANINPNLLLIKNHKISLNNNAYIHKNQRGKVVLGYQNTFWPSQTGQRYWGLTTVEHWSKNNRANNTPTNNFVKNAPILPAGDYVLTVSGGGKQNLIANEKSPAEFEEFRGGVAFHRGVSPNVTMGVGFVYENLLEGFSQFTFGNDRFPLKTTVSLLTGQEGLGFYSHVAFKPANNFIVNYYQDTSKHQFDLNWRMIPGLNFIARGNSKQDSMTTGLKIAINNELFSLFAKAELDNNNWKWNLDSTLGIFQLIYASNQFKRNSEISLNLLKFESFGFQCALFLKHEISNAKERDTEQSFVAWGGKLHSDEKLGRNKYRWAIELGYGSGVHGQGAIASVSTVLPSNLRLKLIYEEISAVSDETKLKFQLSSK
jgi:hypothetical protein